MNKLFKLSLSYVLITALALSCRFIENDPEPAEKPDQTKNIGIQGGTISIDQTATVLFSNGTFKSETTVAVTKTENNADLNSLFDGLTKPLYGVEKRADYYIKVASDSKRPQRTVTVRLNVPQSLSNATKPGLALEVFALLNQSVSAEAMLNFDVVPSRYNAVSKTLEVDLPNYYFDYQNNGKRYEAVLTIGLVPGQNKGARVAGEECNGVFISCPLQTCVQTDPFNPQRTHPTLKDDEGNPIIRPHLGADFRASNIPVFAAADGEIKIATTQRDNKGNVTGWGNYIVIEHTNASGQRFATLYAHLSELRKTSGKVKENDLIAVSGSSGTGNAPHLHFEYIVNGNIADRNARIDPTPLINETSVRLISATAKQTGVNNCSGGSSWVVSFDYRDPKFNLDSKATLTFQDVEPVLNAPYTVNAGTLKSASGLVSSPTFCARFGQYSYFKVKVYMTQSNGVRSNCIYFILRKEGNAARVSADDAPATGAVGSNI
ncbi:hypothetical protein GCM10023187_52660 [Nibrella viscosa]|uniref:M23ase beta-sheet core domain-containing protein n=1 Tax=Nibrella viscosa TaxID=1084524 RepID=A0ABP8KYH0_9BACT